MMVKRRSEQESYKQELIKIRNCFFAHYVDLTAEQINELNTDNNYDTLFHQSALFDLFETYLIKKCKTTFGRQDIFDFLTEGDNIKLLENIEYKLDTFISLYYLMLAFSYLIFENTEFQTKIHNANNEFVGICISRPKQGAHNIGPILALPIAFALVHTIPTIPTPSNQ